jgi:hypothetical protein
MRARAALHALRPDDAPPITTAINDARRQARRHLETGGATVLQRRRVDDHSDPADFVLPPDIDAEDVAKAIETKLRGIRGSCARKKVRWASRGVWVSPASAWRRPL